MARRDYYEILGVSRDVERAGLMSAYRRLAIQYQPDRNPNDPEAAENMRAALRDRSGFESMDDPYRAVEGADVLFVVTEWREFRSPDFKRLRARMRQPVLIDGRNLYEPQMVRGAGFRYESIGRP